MLTRIKLWARRAFLENIGTKLISLLIALLLFFFVREGQTENKVLTVPIELKVPRGVVQTNEVARQVELHIAGPKATVDRLTPESLGPLVVDLSPFGIGASTYFFQKEMISTLPKDVSVTSITPSYVAVRIEKEVSRSLPITPILKGRPARGYHVDRYSMSDKEAELIGPTSLVDRTDFLETAPIDISGATKSVTKQVPIRLPAPSTRLSKTEPVTVTIHIVEEIAERSIQQVRVVLPEGTKLVPDPATVKITLKGPAHIIDTIRADQLGALIKKQPLAADTQVQVDTISGLPVEVAAAGELPVIKLLAPRQREKETKQKPRPLKKRRESGTAK